MSHRHLAPAALSPSLFLSCQLPCLPDDQTQLGPDGGGGRLLLSVGEVLTPNPILEIKTAERTNTVASQWPPHPHWWSQFISFLWTFGVVVVVLTSMYSLGNGHLLENGSGYK